MVFANLTRLVTSWVCMECLQRMKDKGRLIIYPQGLHHHPYHTPRLDYSFRRKLFGCQECKSQPITAHASSSLFLLCGQNHGGSLGKTPTMSLVHWKQKSDLDSSQNRMRHSRTRSPCWVEGRGQTGEAWRGSAMVPLDSCLSIRLMELRITCAHECRGLQQLTMLGTLLLSYKHASEIDKFMPASFCRGNSLTGSLVQGSHWWADTLSTKHRGNWGLFPSR